jgi:broad specificity phosphatase PhoE
MKYYKLSKSDNINLIGSGKNMDNNLFDKEIYFIRHGETLWNVLGKYQGQEADIKLNEKGIKQSKISGKYLQKFRCNDIKFDCVISSPLKRCKKTAKIICKYIDYDKSNIIYMNEISEIKKGNMSGLSKNDDLIIKFDKLFNEKINSIIDPIDNYRYIYSVLDGYALVNDIINDNNLDISGLETYDEIIDRTNYFIDYLQKTDKRKILVVSHSGYLETLLQTIFKLGVLPYGDFTPGKNCSICYCTLKDDIFSMISPLNTEHLSIDFD